VVSDTTSLDISSDSDLLLFTAYLIESNGDTTGSVTDVSSIINNSLMAFSDRYKIYKVEIPPNITDAIKIKARMRFRSFKPDILRGSHQNLLENLPIFDMAQDSVIVTISP
jgi:mevalonate kinase